MLLIDSGNSAIKCRLIEQNRVTDRSFSIHHDSNLIAFSEYLSTIKTDEVYLASVSSKEISRKIKQLITQNTASVFSQLYTLAELNGVRNGYDDVTQLGVDRWLSLLAAFDIARNDVFIIDAGSAITIDLLSLSKGHLGGAILPGFNTDRHRFEQIFPQLDFNHPAIHKTDLPGRSTLSCIHVTDFPVTSSQVNQILLDWQRLLEPPVSALLCGQDAGLLSRQLEFEYAIVADLVFKGMLKQIQLQG